MKPKLKRDVDITPASISELLLSQPTTLLGAFYEMQSSFLIGVYNRYLNIETASIISCFARRTHLEILRQREKNLDHDISLNKFWDNYNKIEKPAEKIVSLAKLTGLPKETARRKVSSLMKKSFVSVNGQKEYFWSISQKNKEGLLKSIDEEIGFLSKFVSYFTNYLGIEMSQKVIENEIKTQFSFYWYHFLSGQLKWLKMWQNKIKDIDLLLITLQAVIPTLKYIGKYNENLSLNEFYKIVGKTNDRYNFSDASISATSISDISGIPRATCIRKLEKLVRLELLIRDSKSKRYFVNQITAGRTKNIITKENVSQTIEIFSDHLSIMINALIRFQ